MNVINPSNNPQESAKVAQSYAQQPPIPAEASFPASNLPGSRDKKEIIQEERALAIREDKVTISVPTVEFETMVTEAEVVGPPAIRQSPTPQNSGLAQQAASKYSDNSVSFRPSHSLVDVYA